MKLNKNDVDSKIVCDWIEKSRKRSKTYSNKNIFTKTFIFHIFEEDGFVVSTSLICKVNNKTQTITNLHLLKYKGKICNSSDKIYKKLNCHEKYAKDLYKNTHTHLSKKQDFENYKIKYLKLKNKYPHKSEKEILLMIKEN